MYIVKYNWIGEWAQEDKDNFISKLTINGKTMTVGYIYMDKEHKRCVYMWRELVSGLV